jgi:hypothetical protein
MDTTGEKEKNAITHFKFIFVDWDILKKKLTGSSQPPCW